MNITHSFIDLDDTIYPAQSGVWKLIKERIYLFMGARYDIPYDDAVALSRNYVQTFGTTFKGLSEHYPIDQDDYFNYVHDIPLEDHLTYDPDLVHALTALPGEKFILTNATSSHARRVLVCLQVADHFSGIIDIKDLAPSCKPHSDAFQKALQIAGNPDPINCVFVDDLENNTRGAMKLGFHAILFGKTQKTDGCSAALMDWKQVESHLLELTDAPR